MSENIDKLLETIASQQRTIELLTMQLNTSKANSIDSVDVLRVLKEAFMEYKDLPVTTNKVLLYRAFSRGDFVTRRWETELIKNKELREFFANNGIEFEDKVTTINGRSYRTISITKSTLNEKLIPLLESPTMFKSFFSK